MRDGPDASVLAGAAGWSPLISAWKGTALVAAEVPVISGRLRATGSQEVPERLTFSVPEWAPTAEYPAGRSWVPDGPDHPLDSFGQWVSASIRVQSSVRPGVEWVTRLGRFKVQSWDHDDLAGEVHVECVGLLQDVLDARFRAPETPRVDGSLTSEFRRLMTAGFPVEVDASLNDRAIPQSFQWSEDRLAALYEICDAWPARLRVDELGTVRVLPPLPEAPDPVLTLTDGDRGTVISAPRSGGRDGVFNVVVARSSRTDDPSSAPLQAVRQVTEGPLRPEEYGEVVKFWSSPLATTYEELAASATTLLADSVRPAVARRVTLAPDPRIELDDAVELVTGRVTTPQVRTVGTTVGGTGFGVGPFGSSPFGGGEPGIPGTSTSTTTATSAGEVSRGWVVGYDLPLTVDDGPMTLTVGMA